jgi:hypothetical protein
MHATTLHYGVVSLLNVVEIVLLVSGTFHLSWIVSSSDAFHSSHTRGIVLRWSPGDGRVFPMFLRANQDVVTIPGTPVCYHGNDPGALV